MPFAVEMFGRLGKEALAHLRALARGSANAVFGDEGVASSSLVARWGCDLSVALQRANASNVHRAIGAAEACCGELASTLVG